jgi:RimJ/RimL family protein N-acetyltransferase
VELRTARLRLRRARPEDLDAIHAVLSDPRATTYWSTPPHTSIDQTRAWLDSMIASPSEVSEDFVVELDGRVIGKAGAWRLPEIGFILHPDVWGQGLAREAVGALVDHIFATRDVEELTADVDPRNLRSLRLVESLGFRRTGSAERTWLVADGWADSVYFAVSRADREQA